MEDTRPVIVRAKSFLKAYVQIQTQSAMPLNEVMQSIDMATHKAIVTALAWHFESNSIELALEKSGIWPINISKQNNPILPVGYK